MKLHLLFASNSLEERFRRLVTDCKEEIGGWFLLGYVEDHDISRRKLKKAISEAPYVIESVIVLPNLSRKPKGEWSCWDLAKATELSRATAKLYGNWPIHFHTHPGATGQPSSADLVFWQAGGGGGRTSFGCIVTDRPLRLWPWQVDVTLAASPSRTTVIKECGGFLSWRSRILKEIRKGNDE